MLFRSLDAGGGAPLHAHDPLQPRRGELLAGLLAAVARLADHVHRPGAGDRPHFLRVEAVEGDVAGEIDVHLAELGRRPNVDERQLVPAAAEIGEEPLLLIDDPFSALDPTRRDQIGQRLADRGAQILITVADEADVPLVLAATDPAVLQFIRGLPASREEAWHRLLRYAGHWSLLGFGMFAVVERATNQFLGDVGLADFQRGLGDNFDGVPEAAWVFKESAHGKGFALEAMRAALNWFDQQAISSRSVCIIDPGNTASIRLAEKLGFNYYDQACQLYSVHSYLTSICNLVHRNLVLQNLELACSALARSRVA